MANYESLKSAIVNVIKANGNKEITGELLQQALISIINALGAGYQFAGIALPSTNPGTPDYNVFYLATEGTYPNFNSATILHGEIGVLKYNGSWICETMNSGIGDYILNVNYYNNENNYYPTKQDARNAVPSELRKLGLIITYMLDDGWHIEQYYSTDTLDDWIYDDEWLTVAPIQINKSEQTILVNYQEVGALGGVYRNEYEFLEVLTDYNGEIIGAYLPNGTRLLNVDFILNGNFKLNGAIDGNLKVLGTFEDNVFSDGIFDSSEYKFILIDDILQIIIGIKPNGDVYFGAGVPQQIKEYVQQMLSSKEPSYIEKFFEAKKNIKSIGSVNQNNRLYTEPYSDLIYNQFNKCSMPYLRDYATPAIYDAYKRGIKILGMFNLSLMTIDINELANEIKSVVNLYNGISDITFGSKQVKIKIDYWNVFNEPELNISGQEQDLFDRLKIIYNTVKAERPECKIVLGGFSTFSNGFFDNLADIRDEDGKAFWDYTDIISYHCYVDTFASIISEFERFKNTANNEYSQNEFKHLANIPIWVTECGTRALSEQNVESVRHIWLPKVMLTLMSYGVEQLFVYKLCSYNFFIFPNGENFYGLISPNYNCAYAGLYYDSDKSAITPDGLLDKVYIDMENGIVPSIDLSLLNKSEIISKGIAINGNGFTLKKIAIAAYNDGVFTEIRTLWSGTTVMDGTNYVSVSGNSFIDTDFSQYLITEIENITLTDKSINDFTYKDSFFSVKFLSEFLQDSIDVPDIIINDTYTLLKWKCTNGTNKYCVWHNSGSADVEFNVNDNSIFWDVKGNQISKPTMIDDKPIYVSNCRYLNINI